MNFPKPYQKNPLFDWSEIDFVISNFVCQNVQTTVGVGGGPNSELSLSVQTFWVHTCLMGGGISGGLDNVQSFVLLD